MSKRVFYFKQFSLTSERSLNFKTVLFQTVKFGINTQFSCIWLIKRTLSGATTTGLRGPENNGNEGVPCIPQISSIIGESSSDWLELYSRCSLGES